MIRTTTIAAALLLPLFSASAQVQSGTVKYEETIRMNFRLDGEAAQFAQLFPKEQKLKQVLHFTPAASMFSPDAAGIAAAEEVAEADGIVRMKIQTDGGNDKVYTDISGGKSVEQRDFMGRKFLVSGDISRTSWKMTGRQQTLLSYPCQEAVSIRDKDTITAWFTTAIPVATGPHGWTGLPGLILAATHNSNISIRATSVNPGPVAAGLIAQPKGGKKVTKEEFERIVDEKMKEMGATGGDGEKIMIRVQRN